MTGPAAQDAGSRFSFSFTEKPRSRLTDNGNVPAASASGGADWDQEKLLLDEYPMMSYGHYVGCPNWSDLIRHQIL